MIETRALPSDTDLLALHRLDALRYPVLLESVASGTAQGRWDFLLVADGKGLRLDADGVTRDLQGNAETGDFLAALDRHWQAERTPRKLRCHGPSMHTPRTAAEATSTVSAASPGRRRPCQRLQLMQRLSLTA
mgnify:CR=1 FL=1